jgi:hypothetical protein
VICLIGYCKAFLIISTPAFWSSPFGFKLFRASEAYNNAHPPPTTTPSCTAALVALSASSTLSFRSLTSISVAPPTLII